MPQLNSSTGKLKAKSPHKGKPSSNTETMGSLIRANSKSSLKSSTISVVSNDRNDSDPAIKLDAILPKALNKKTSTAPLKTKVSKAHVTALKSRKICKLNNQPKSKSSTDDSSGRLSNTSEEKSASPMVKVFVIPTNCGRPGGPEKCAQSQKCTEAVTTKVNSGSTEPVGVVQSAKAVTVEVSGSEPATVDSPLSEPKVDSSVKPANSVIGQSEKPSALGVTDVAHQQQLGARISWPIVLSIVFALGAIIVGLIVAQRIWADKL